MNLNDLGLKYGTDKSTLLHNYLNKYEPYFANPTDVKKILEIGLRRGGKWKNEHITPSLEMWGEFFPNAKLYGFDIKYLKTQNQRISLSQGDQSNMDDMVKLSNSIGAGLDFIIDDGSHLPSHQLVTFLLLFPNLKENGVYIIEDCNAVAQSKYIREEQIHAIIKPYLGHIEHYWISSDTAGEKSSLILIK